MGKITTILNIIFCWVVFFISYFIPRNKYIWAFNGWFKNEERQTFADNSKYVFLEVQNEYRNIKAVWIGEDEYICRTLKQSGYTAHSIHSFWGVYYSLRAGCTVIDANFKLGNWCLSNGSRIVQLWHADGIKKLSYTSKVNFTNFFNFLAKPNLFQKFSLLISSSEYIREKFTCPSFDVIPEKVKITGLPRYDAFFNTKLGQEIDIHEELKKAIELIKRKSSNKIVLYAPTFRRNKTLSEQLSPVDFKLLNERLSSGDNFLIVSLHPKFAASGWVPAAEYSNIIFSNPGYDVYPLLKDFDMVITDYSSICIDFLMLNKPSIFYIYDFDEYRQNEGLADDFWNYMPGLRVKTFEELISAINMGTESLMKDMEEARDVVFTHTDSSNSKRVVAEIMKLNNIK